MLHCRGRHTKMNEQASPDGTERKPGRRQRLTTIPDYTPLYPGYVTTKDGKNVGLRRVAWDFLPRPHSLQSETKRLRFGKRAGHCVVGTGPF
jgi:hypothetical protein